jgi:predicted AAA+ superfamily ATPase
MGFERALVMELATACRRRVAVIQVIVGPRQVGKTTAAQQLVARLAWPSVFAAADAPLPHGPEWIETQWRAAQGLRRGRSGRVLLVLDEIQKVRGWSETLKRLWDEQQRAGGGIQPVLLGSSALLVQQGVTESLAGRFRLHRCPHWSWTECRTAFGWDLRRWLYFGGYPGAAPLVRTEADWKRYIADSLIEPAIARDVLQMHQIAKPALLRQLFALAAAYPAQILSYNKMLGQLQDAGNTTTLAHYLRLLETAWMVSGLELHSAGVVRKRGSSPKLVLWNNALISALSTHRRADVQRDGGMWGRLVENAVGAHLLNGLQGPEWSVNYWRDGDREVDYVVASGRAVWAIEVKSGRAGKLAGLEAFRRRYPRSHALLVGGGGLDLERFFEAPPQQWFA